MKCTVTLIFLLSAVVAVSARHLDRKTLRGRRPPFPRGGSLGVYDGSNTTIEAHPYMVSILALDDLWCAGTIVSKSWVLTVASWLSYWTLDEYTVLVGSNSSNTGGKEYAMKQYVLHPDFNDGFDYDFACAQIDGQFTWSSTVNLIKLPTTKVKVKMSLEIVGWGSTEFSDYGDPSPNLKQGSMKIVSSSVCNSYYTEMYGFTGMTKTMICVYNKGKTSACLDDQGDPYIKNGVIYGQLSITPPDLQVCTSDAGPVIMSNIPAVAPWIKNVTGASYENE